MTASRKAVWFAVAAAALAILAVAWFQASFEEVAIDRHEGMQREAQRNPWLAAERTFARLGRPLVRVGSPAALETHRVGGTLLLDAHRRRGVPPERAELILNWVADGGYLIVAAEPVDHDPVLNALGIRRCERRTSRGKPRAEGDPCRPAEHPGPTATVRLPGDDARPFRLRRGTLQLVTSRRNPEWRAEGNGGWLHLRHGRGEITVVDGFDFANNHQLGRLDHADLLWALVSRYQPTGEIRVAARMSMPSLREWLLESAAPAIAAAAVLLMLWLWQVVPRFGPTQSPPATDRRELRQHLTAIGRCVWREAGLRHWLNVVRADVDARMALRHPQYGLLTHDDRRQLFGRMAGASGPEIWNALSRGRGETPDEFTAAMRTLQRIDRHRLDDASSRSPTPPPPAATSMPKEPTR